MNKKLSIGDTLYRRKGIVEHVGLLIRPDQVLHNSPDGNVQISSFLEYSEGKNVKVVSNSLAPHEKLRLLNEAEKMLNQAQTYGVITFNCEHLVSLIQSGKPTSEQLQGSCIGGLIGFAMALLTNSQNKAAWTATGALIGCTVVNANRAYDLEVKGIK